MIRLTLLLALLVVIAAPVARANQAANFKGTVEDGSRASLSGSATVPSTGGVIATLRVESTGSSGLFQFGNIKEGASETSDCGTGTIGYMIERQPAGGSYTCDIYFGSFGSQHKFSVLRAANGSGFSAYLDGNYFAGPWALGFPSDGVAFASAEYKGTAPSSYDFVWGPTTGNTPWQETTDYGANWHTITSATPYNEGGWNVQLAPSPFHITR